ncbi:MAG: leucine/isoleucine/valine transporter permease subunit [Chloroflexi bacterium]|nr:MAG: leucine/isoleucine/valine transporter permease subunit [Chloroflexota bacterium]
MRTGDLKRMVKAGLIGGIVAVFISVIGMVEAFSRRELIVGVVSIGHTLLILVVMVTTYFLIQQRRASAAVSGTLHGRASLIFGSTIAAAVIGLMLGVLAALAITFNLRTVLINVSPELIAMLTLGVPGIAGALAPLIATTVFGAAGGAIFTLPPRPRRILLSGLIFLTFFGLISDLIRISMNALPARVTRQLVTTTGLKPLGAGILFLAVVGISYASQRWKNRLSDRIAGLPPARQRTFRYGQWALLVIGLAALPWIVGRVPSDVLVKVGIFVLMGFGLNIVVGKAGMLDLGYVAFFAVGAYSMAIFTSADELPNITLSFWAALPLVIIITGIAGLLVGAPVIRMRADYLAIVTLGFGEIARFLALSDWFTPVLGGAQGVIKIPDASVFGFALVGPQNLYYLILVFCLAALFISYRLEGSRVGRAWVAMREDESVAEVMGVNTVYYKLLAFLIGAMIASLGGAVFAVKLGAIFPHSFSVEVSITALSLLIIGGLGSLPGVIVGAFALVGLPELLREFEEYRFLIYGAVIIFMMIVRPQGLMPAVRRGRELSEAERAQDAVKGMDEAAIPTAASD